MLMKTVVQDEWPFIAGTAEDMFYISPTLRLGEGKWWTIVEHRLLSVITCVRACMRVCARAKKQDTIF